jgi:hypothetical protein
MLLFANFETSFAYFETHLHILKLKNIGILIIKTQMPGLPWESRQCDDFGYRGVPRGIYLGRNSFMRSE